jgi:TIR domain
MSYVPGFASDIFVSYATVDNEVMVVDGDEHKGWVNVLVEKLRRELNSRIGGRAVSVFLDHESMRSNRPLTPQLIEAARSSATLLVVMSRSYLASDWCKLERNAFLSVVNDRIATGSMLVVRARPVERDEQPEEFRDLRGIDFFHADTGSRHRLLGSPNANELPFVDRICTLTEELALQLERLRAGAEHRAPRETGVKVFVAAATDDLEEREKDLHGYLSQAGLTVLPSPQSRYPANALDSYEAAVLHELSDCTVFAQLLSASRGRELEFAPGQRLPSLHLELARRAQLPIMQWRSRDLDLDSVKDPRHRALLDGAQACGIEQFKRDLLAQARKKPTPRRPLSTQVMVFVNANASDRGLARELGNTLSAMGVDCYWPIEDGSPEVIRADLEDNLNSCDGLVLVYGQTRLDWVHQQLRQARKTLSIRERPIKTLAIFEGPPSEKPNLAVAIPQLVTLNCRNGVDPNTLRLFVATLQE